MAALGQRSPKLTTIIDAAVKYFRYCFSLLILLHSLRSPEPGTFSSLLILLRSLLTVKPVKESSFRINTNGTLFCNIVLQKTIAND